MYDTSGQNLTPEEIEAFNMWLNKQHKILPTQYHHFYDQGDTLIYPEHIADLLTIDRMYQNRLKKDHDKEKAKNDAKNNNPLKNNNQGSNFYGKKFVYKK